MLQEIDLVLDAKDGSSEQATDDLYRWLNMEEGIRVKRERGAPEEGSMGIDPLSILTVVLGSAAAVKLAESLHVWIENRRPKIKIRIVNGDRSIEIETNNVESQQELIEKINSILE